MKRLCLLALGALVLAAGCGKDITSTEVQPVPEAFDRVVLAELYTSFTCSNCPAAEEALDRLYEEIGPDSLAVIHWHYGDATWPDPLAIAASKSRLDAYNENLEISFGLPSCVFDGRDIQKGGNAETYSDYADRFDNEVVQQSPLKITATPALEGLDLDVALTIEAMPDTSFTGLDLTVVVVEHDAENPWPSGPPVYSFVARDVSVESISISGETPQEWTAGFTLEATWVAANIYVVAFLQEPDLGEVLQAAMTAAGTEG